MKNNQESKVVTGLQAFCLTLWDEAQKFDEILVIMQVLASEY